MKTSYVHVQTPYGRSLGFSARILAFAPSECSADDEAFGSKWNDKGDAMCYVSVTFCNKKDKHFCKKTARTELETKPEEWVRCRDVPRILGEAMARSMNWKGRVDNSSFNYVLRRFL